jgi:hypothetical protein
MSKGSGRFEIVELDEEISYLRIGQAIISSV